MANAYLPANPSDQEVETYLNSRVVVSIDSVANFRTTNFGDIKAVAYDGIVFSRDDGDSVSVHNGTTILVDSQGTRFIANGFKFPTSVKGAVQAPPSNPAVGDAWFVAANPSGAFAGHASKIAVYTLWEWKFITPEIGMSVYSQADSGFFHYSLSGVWETGLGNVGAANIFPDSQVFPSNLIVDSIRSAPTTASNNTLNNLANAGNPRAYLVSSNGTGAFQGKNNNVAIFYNSAWKFIAPKQGMEINLKDGTKRRWNGTEWLYLTNAGIIDDLTEIRIRASTFRNRNAVSAQGGQNARVLWQGNYSLKSDSQWLQVRINGGRIRARVAQIKASHGGHTPVIGTLSMEIGLYADSGANEIARIATVRHNVYGHQAWLNDFRHNFSIEAYSHHINYGSPNVSFGGNFLEQSNESILGRVTKNTRTINLRIIAKFKIQLVGTDALVDFISQDAANRIEFPNNDSLYCTITEWRGSNAVDG